MKTRLRFASVLLLASSFVVGCQDEEVLNGGNGTRGEVADIVRLDVFDQLPYLWRFRF